jgi:hypothetical protein
MNKYEWRKQEKELYLPTKKPSALLVPEMSFFTLEGRGNPNSELFKEHIEILYAMSYAIRMMPKKGMTPVGYFEYTVYPLEGHWDLDEEGRELDYLHKDHLVYKIMIRQPGFVTEEWFQFALDRVKKKKAHPDIENVRWENITEGLCVQAMHIGSYDDEPETFRMMEDFCSENHLQRAEKTHKEIYISDPRKTSPDKLKTVLRFKVNEKIG